MLKNYRQYFYFSETHITDNPIFLKVILSTNLKIGTNELNNPICPLGIVFLLRIFPEKNHPNIPIVLKKNNF